MKHVLVDKRALTWYRKQGRLIRIIDKVLDQYLIEIHEYAL
jgi:hypothetical protein